jgi:hypothetical protein
MLKLTDNPHEFFQVSDKVLAIVNSIISEHELLFGQFPDLIIRPRPPPL